MFAAFVAAALAAELIVWSTSPELPGLAIRTEIAMLHATHRVPPMTERGGGATSPQLQCQFQMIVVPGWPTGTFVTGTSLGSQFQLQFQTNVDAGVDDDTTGSVGAAFETAPVILFGLSPVVLPISLAAGVAGGSGWAGVTGDWVVVARVCGAEGAGGAAGALLGVLLGAADSGETGVGSGATTGGIGVETGSTTGVSTTGAGSTATGGVTATVGTTSVTGVAGIAAAAGSPGRRSSAFAGLATAASASVRAPQIDAPDRSERFVIMIYR